MLPEQTEHLFVYLAQMDRVEVDGCLLSWEADGTGALFGVCGSNEGFASPAGNSMFRFTARGRRLCVGLGFPPTSRFLDVSIQPAVFEQVLPAGSCTPSRPGSSASILARWVAKLAELTPTWRPSEPDHLGVVGTVGGAAFPLLGAAYGHGVEPMREIPRWAAPYLLIRRRGKQLRGHSVRRPLGLSFARSPRASSRASDATSPTALSPPCDRQSGCFSWHSHWRASRSSSQTTLSGS